MHGRRYENAGAPSDSSDDDSDDDNNAFDGSDDAARTPLGASAPKAKGARARARAEAEAECAATFVREYSLAAHGERRRLVCVSPGARLEILVATDGSWRLLSRNVPKFARLFLMSIIVHYSQSTSTSY